MAVKLPNNYPFQDTPQFFCLHGSIDSPPFSYPCLQIQHPNTHIFGVNSPLNHELSGELAHCQVMLTSTSLWDVRGEPAIGSIMDFGPRPGDWTLKLSSVGYNWNFVACFPPNLSTRHSQTMIKQTLSHITYCHTIKFTCKKKKKKIHPSAFVTVGLVL